MKLKINLKMFIILGVSFFLSSCTFTHWKHLTPQEFRSSEFYRKTLKIKDRNIEDLKNAYLLYQAGNKATYFVTNIKVNRSEKSATIWWQGMGLMSLSTMALADFEEGSDNSLTIKIYAAGEGWAEHPEKIIELLD
jgi:hypothetical protein